MQRYRVFLIAFDLKGTLPGDPRYRAADDAMKSHGAVFRPVKQIRLLITRSASKRVMESLEQQIGRQTTLLIVPITVVGAWSIFGPDKRREWINFVNTAEHCGIEVKNLSDDPRSPSS